MSRSKPILALAAFAVALGVGACSTTSLAPGSPSPPQLPSRGAGAPPAATAYDTWHAIPVSGLAQQHVTMQITSAATKIERPIAEATALKTSPSLTGTILNTVLTRFQDPGAATDCICWVVSFDPQQTTYSHGPLGSPILRFNYWISAVDANTGAVIDAMAGRDNSLPDFPTPSPAS